ncbi:MAG: type III-B CRISPR module-associated protein Cmr5 [Deltaproteobacteria bacterium]|nr:type III-B CRISPR module-associated protein Cmr5 [Deltaproteobacteria bacterium]
MSGRTTDQERARHAWERIEVLKGEKERNADKAGKCGREARKLPVRILTAGLGPALLYVTNKDETGILAKALGEWMSRRFPPAGGQPVELLERIVKGDGTFLKLATGEALAWLQWFVRFAEAENLVGKED